VSDEMSVSRGLAIALMYCGLGLYSFWRGRVMLTTAPHTPSGLPWLVIELIRRTQGETAAAHKKAQLMQPDRIRRSGYYALVAGSMLLIAGGLQLAGWIGKIMGL
jgi:hypothetical protein